MDKYTESIQYIKTRIESRPCIAVILGSGLGEFADELSSKTIVPAREIPNYPASTVEGHAGKLVFGKVQAVEVLVFQGRIHFYEGYSIYDVVYPVMIASGLGIKTLIVTNTSGGINPQFRPADLMLITDHINFAFEDPRIGNPYISHQFKRRLPPYDENLLRLVEQTALGLGISLRRGVYLWTKGPSYETPAEIEMFRRIGADAAGMSTVPEVIMAHHLGMKIVGISLITNLAAGMAPFGTTKLSHADVTKVAGEARDKFSLLLREIILRMSSQTTLAFRM